MSKLRNTKITHDEKETALEALKVHGTMQYAAKITGVSVRTLNEEMKRSEVFRRRVMEAREEGKRNLGDEQIEFIKSVAAGEVEVKMPRLTAALSLANWAVQGFRGTTNVQGKIEHDVRVITAVPRPKYDELEAPKVKVLKEGKLTVEENIEGVAVETEESLV